MDCIFNRCLVSVFDVLILGITVVRLVEKDVLSSSEYESESESSGSESSSESEHDFGFVRETAGLCLLYVINKAVER